MFGKHKLHKDGLQSLCKLCKAKSDRLYYEKVRLETAFITHKAQYLHKWQQANSDKVKLSNARRVALRKGATIDTMPSDFFIMMKEFYGEICMFPGCDKDLVEHSLQPDHIIPLSKGGSHSMDNLQILCAHHNYSKGNRNEIDYRPYPRLFLSQL